MTSPAPNPGTLYVVATPIGNLGDMVPRAVETLQTVAPIAAEDTRHSSRLLSHFDIKTPCIAYHDHSDEQRTEQLIARMHAGDSIALISDAGTPLVSDPGYRLVRSARQAGIQVVPVPGAQIAFWNVIDADDDNLEATFSLRLRDTESWTDVAVASPESFLQFDTTHLAEGTYETRLVVTEAAPRPAGAPCQPRCSCWPCLHW